MQIVILEFETRCVELLEYVHTSGEEIIVTMNGEPFVRVSGIVETLFEKPQRVLGVQNGVVSFSESQDSLIRSDLENDWEASIPQRSGGSDACRYGYGTGLPSVDR